MQLFIGKYRQLSTGIFLLVLILGLTAFAYKLKALEVDELRFQLDVVRAKIATEKKAREEAVARLGIYERTYPSPEQVRADYKRDKAAGYLGTSKRIVDVSAFYK